MSPPALGVLVAGLLLVALVAGVALLAQRRWERRPRGRVLPPAAPAARPRPPAAAPPPPASRPPAGNPPTTALPTSSPPATDPPAAAPREEVNTEPITSRTAQEDPATVQYPVPRHGEGGQHPTPPPTNGNGRAH